MMHDNESDDDNDDDDESLQTSGAQGHYYADHGLGGGAVLDTRRLRHLNFHHKSIVFKSAPLLESMSGYSLLNSFKNLTKTPPTIF